MLSERTLICIIIVIVYDDTCYFYDPGMMAVQLPLLTVNSYHTCPIWQEEIPEDFLVLVTYTAGAFDSNWNILTLALNLLTVVILALPSPYTTSYT